MMKRISIQNHSRSRIPPHAQLRTLSSILQRTHGVAKAHLELVFVSDRQIRPYYKEYFGENRATDVIAFPMDEADHLGSIVISVDTARRQAKEHKQSLWNEIRFLIIHGFLHLLGHDHARPAETQRMKKAERELLKKTKSIHE